MPCCREAVQNMFPSAPCQRASTYLLSAEEVNGALCQKLLRSWNSKDVVAISQTAEMGEQSPLCDGGVAFCVVLPGFVTLTRCVFHSSDAASRRALQLALQQLAESQPDATAKNLLQSLQSSGIGGKAGVPRCCMGCFVWQQF